LTQKKLIFIIPLLVFLVYSGLLLPGSFKFRTAQNNMNYFKELAVSFMHGRLDIDLPKNTDGHDLVFYGGKYYLYWPPVPALVYIPFSLAWGTNTPDDTIIAAIGAINSMLLIILLALFSRRFGLNLPDYVIALLAVFWAFGTVHFYVSMVGSVWFFSQVLAQSFLMLSIIFALKQGLLQNILISGAFFALAAYTKNDVVFAGFFLAAVFAAKQSRLNIKSAVKATAVFLMPFILLSGLNMWYNKARFNDPLYNGINHHKMASNFMEDFKTYGYMSLHYVPRNVLYEVIKPMKIKFSWPIIIFDGDGFGFLWASPVFFLIFPAAYFFFLNIIGKNKRLARSDLIIMAGAAVSAFFIALTIFLIMGTGWVQFGSRYSIDYQFMLLLFGLFLYKIWRGRRGFNITFFVLLGFSVMINYIGVWEYVLTR
jgi:hypothetical protein